MGQKHPKLKYFDKIEDLNRASAAIQDILYEAESANDPQAILIDCTALMKAMGSSTDKILELYDLRFKEHPLVQEEVLRIKIVEGY